MNAIYYKNGKDWVDCPYCKQSNNIDRLCNYVDVEQDVSVKLQCVKCKSNFVLLITGEPWIHNET